MRTCDGCEATEAAGQTCSFQCPLCQAEGKDTGYFCGQECFAKAWLAHRNTVHPSAVARAGNRKQADGVDDATEKPSRSSKRKRLREDAAAADSTKPAAMCHVRSWPTFTRPTLVLERRPSHPGAGDGTNLETRMVATPRGDGMGMWESILFAGAYISTRTTASETVVIVAGSTAVCGAVSWVARATFGLNPLVVCSRRAEDMQLSPQSLIERLRSAAAEGKASDAPTVVIVSEAVFRGSALLGESDDDEETANALAKVCQRSPSLNPHAWTSGTVLVTLPDVVEPLEYQAANTRACFITSSTSDGASDRYRFEESEVTHDFEIRDVTPELQQLSFAAVPPPAAAEDAVLKSMSTITARCDNELTTLVANALYERAATRFLHMFIHDSKSRGEAALRNALLTCWGAFQGDEVEHHHALAYFLRVLLAECKSHIASTDLRHAYGVVCRAIARTAALVLPIPAGEEAARSQHHNTVLHATLCAFFEHIPTDCVDAFGLAWGLPRIVCGVESMADQVNGLRQVWQRLQHRHEPRLGSFQTPFVIALMLLLRAESSVSMLTVADVERKTRWSTSSYLRKQLGELVSFLDDCELLRQASSGGSISALNRATYLKASGNPAVPATKGGQKSKKAASVAYSEFVGPRESKLPSAASASKTPRTMTNRLPLVELPLSGAVRRKKEGLATMAAIEILSAMPSNPTPMFVGDVGNLVGAWTKFNAKYEGRLPVSLLAFLESQPEHFRVVGKLVTRVKAGVTRPVRIRYDGDDHDDHEADSEDERERRAEKKKLASLLTGGNVKLDSQTASKVLKSGKARRQLRKKLTNAARFDRNKKSFDPESKVPGYKKRSLLDMKKGRGKKANIRRWKR